jgi:hypothetical protein
MITTIEIQAGYQRGENFFTANTPWYMNNTTNFDRVLAQVESGRNEFGEPVVFEHGTEIVRISEIARNGSHGETVRQADVPVR